VRIPYAQLVLSGKLGAGSQGAIYRAQPNPAFELSFPLIYKEFSATTVVAGMSLELLARFRADLDDKDRAVLDLRTVWPAAVVEKNGRVCGYVMQEIPDTFMQTIRTTSGTEPIPREIQHLFVADALARKNIGEIPESTERLALAREAAFVLGFLHKRELIFGDLSYKNAVYALRPKPMVMLLDCDAVRRRGQGSAVPQLNSPGWGAPEKGPQTIESDRYKLGLFILRCLTPGVNAQNRDPEKATAVLDHEGMGLLRRAVGDDPAARPSGKQWVEYLDARIAGAGGVRARTGAAAKPAPPPKREKVRTARRASAAAVGAAPRAGRTYARPVGTSAPRGTPLGANPPAQGGFGSPPAWSRPRWPLSPSQPFTYRLAPPGAKGTLTPAMRVIVGLLLFLTVLVLVGQLSKTPTASRTNGTLATLPTTLVPGAPANVLWPTDAKPLTGAATQAVTKVTAAAGPGWQPTAFWSEPVRPVPGADAQPVWTVQMLADAPAPGTDPGRRPARTYKIGATGDVVLVDSSTRVLPPSGTAQTLSPLWPVALQRAIDLVSTPIRRSGPILVRFDCTNEDTPVCGWELRFLKSDEQPTEVDRVYVTGNGEKTMLAPAWASPR
jgi:hypothetical protein